jgi:hypothetical protein
LKIHLVKTQAGMVAADHETEEYLKKIGLGEMIGGEFKKTRNYRFLKKWFALLNIGYDNWQAPEVESVHGVPVKNFERFRGDICILCGFYHQTIRLNGEVRIEPKSVSFGRMTEDEFSDLYSKTITVLIENVWRGSLTEEEVNQMVDTYLSFT